MKKTFYWACFLAPILTALLAISGWDWWFVAEVLGLVAAGMVGMCLSLFGLMKLVLD